MEPTISTSPKTKKQRIREELLMLGGLEESLRLAIVDRDKPFIKLLTDMKTEHYQKLRSMIDGYPATEEHLEPEERS